MKRDQTQKAMRDRINGERKAELRELYALQDKGLLTPFVPEWDNGACRGVTPETAEKFHPMNGQASQAYRIIRDFCEHCPIRKHCLRFAVATHQDSGVWGGTTSTMRRTARPIETPSNGPRSAKTVK